MFEMKVLELFGEPVSNGGQESFVMNVLSHMPETIWFSTCSRRTIAITSATAP